mgnify:CR=1 FL=1
MIVNIFRLFLLFLMLFLLSCTSAPRYHGSSVSPSKRDKKPYINEKPYIVHKKDSNARKKYAGKKVLKGLSSYYGKDFHGKLTANGEIFDMYGRTAAHKTLPLNTIVRVINEENQKSLILRINDRGPYIPGRMLDCSYGAALKLGFIEQGVANVRVEIIELGDDSYIHHKSR